jgi:WD40 repeat protein
MEFHPQEFLLATGSTDKTIKFWDLETLDFVSTTEMDMGSPQAFAFHPDCVVAAHSSDSLKTWGWEPAICYDNAPVAWKGPILDVHITGDQVIACSVSQLSHVSVWVANLNKLKPLSNTSIVTQSPTTTTVEEPAFEIPPSQPQPKAQPSQSLPQVVNVSNSNASLHSKPVDLSSTIDLNSTTDALKQLHGHYTSAHNASNSYSAIHGGNNHFTVEKVTITGPGKSTQEPQDPFYTSFQNASQNTKQQQSTNNTKPKSSGGSRASISSYHKSIPDFIPIKEDPKNLAPIEKPFPLEMPFNPVRCSDKVLTIFTENSRCRRRDD